MYLRLLTLGLVTVIACGTARSDEQATPQTVSGDWHAIAYSLSTSAPPSMCEAMNVAAGFGFRRDTLGLRIYMVDKRWSLPPNVEGRIDVAIGRYQQVFFITENDATSVSAIVQAARLNELFSVMDNSDIMIVTAGNAKPISMSLVGSSRVTHAFRTCTGISDSKQVPGFSAPGYNPFTK